MEDQPLPWSTDEVVGDVLHEIARIALLDRGLHRRYGLTDTLLVGRAAAGGAEYGSTEDDKLQYRSH